MQILIKIATLKGVFLEKETYMAILPSSEGEVGVMPLHENFIFKLTSGLVKLYKNENHITDKIFIFDGFAQVHKDEIDIVASNVMKLEDLDIKEAQQKVREFESELMSSDKEDYVQLIQKKLELYRKILEVAHFK